MWAFSTWLLGKKKHLKGNIGDNHDNGNSKSNSTYFLRSLTQQVLIYHLLLLIGYNYCSRDMEKFEEFITQSWKKDICMLSQSSDIMSQCSDM